MDRFDKLIATGVGSIITIVLSGYIIMYIDNRKFDKTLIEAAKNGGNIYINHKFKKGSN